MKKKEEEVMLQPVWRVSGLAWLDPPVVCEDRPTRCCGSAVPVLTPASGVTAQLARMCDSPSGVWAPVVLSGAPPSVDVRPTGHRRGAGSVRRPRAPLLSLQQRSPAAPRASPSVGRSASQAGRACRDRCLLAAIVLGVDGGGTCVCCGLGSVGRTRTH